MRSIPFENAKELRSSRAFVYHHGSNQPNPAFRDLSSPAFVPVERPRVQWKRPGKKSARLLKRPVSDGILLKKGSRWRSLVADGDCWQRGLREATGPACAQVAGSGVGGVISFASLRRFWAVAARRNSSRAPHGPRSRRRSRRRMRLRWANSISTFFRCRRELQ